MVVCPVLQRHMSILASISAISMAAGTAYAGPPFLTDDPVPTEQGRWELYGPFLEIEGRGEVFGGASGVELNYGAAESLQLTVGLPAAFSRESDKWRWGAGDIEVSAKYRIINDDASGVQVALFPGLSVPTASNGMGAGRVTALLPVWVQKDFVAWSIFGGGGYAINPGAANRNYWTGGIALSRQWNDRVLLGLEVDRQGPDEISGAATTSLGVGAIYDIQGPLRLLASGGPDFEDGGGTVGYHAFLALGIDF